MSKIFCYRCGTTVEISTLMKCGCTTDIIALGDFDEIGCEPNSDETAKLDNECWWPANTLLIGKDASRAYTEDSVYLLIDAFQ